ncbi:MAG: 5-(carboxyamino)imidazole ribonucleotide mutase [Clostridium sp.]|nr:5-(carboxyamino)imidazole ribonucleotide mutase [Clostridium sp.]
MEKNNSGALKGPRVAVVMGSDSDFEVLRDCIETLKRFGIEVSVSVCSAHRTPDRAADFAKNARNDGVDVIIAAAGKAAHLPGVLAAYTTLPVIGVPIKSSTLDGLDALLSIVQMPSGIPVATMAINGAHNAALLAVQILSVGYTGLVKEMEKYRSELAENVQQKDMVIQEKVRSI